jgi:hypothetical protein
MDGALGWIPRRYEVEVPIVQRRWRTGRGYGQLGLIHCGLGHDLCVQWRIVESTELFPDLAIAAGASVGRNWFMAAGCRFRCCSSIWCISRRQADIQPREGHCKVRSRPQSNRLWGARDECFRYMQSKSIRF